MEWVFKWLKILLIIALCVLMIIIRARGKILGSGIPTNQKYIDIFSVGSGKVDSSKYLYLDLTLILQ